MWKSTTRDDCTFLCVCLYLDDNEKHKSHLFTSEKGINLYQLVVAAWVTWLLEGILVTKNGPKRKKEIHMTALVGSRGLLDWRFLVICLKEEVQEFVLFITWKSETNETMNLKCSNSTLLWSAWHSPSASPWSTKMQQFPQFCQALKVFKSHVADL